MKPITIKNARLTYVEQPLIQPFGFKGSYITSLTIANATLESGNFSFTVPATQSVLWSDDRVFGEFGPKKGDEIMLALTERAISIISGTTFETPISVTESLIEPLSEYAESLCGFKVKPTFVLNSLVGIDVALWSIYAAENGISDFNGIIPPLAKPYMTESSCNLAQIPLISYAVSEEEIKEALDSGIALLKIKIGAPADSPQQMVEKDCARLKQIHSIADKYTSKLTKSGKICYYLDANSRYDTKERLEQLLDFAKENGFIQNIVLLEEPFALDSTIDVSSLGVNICADESAHSVEDVENRIKLGYKAVALKPIAKTVSVSFQMAATAIRHGCECFCADLTVTPYLALWNMMFSSKLPFISGMNCGCVEVNGDKNYINWEQLANSLPNSLGFNGAENGVFDITNHQHIFNSLTGR